MKCQAVNCENEASVLFQFGDDSPLGLCSACGSYDRQARFSADPSQIKLQPLTKRLERLLVKLYAEHPLHIG